MITMVACIIGAMALFALGVAVWMVVMVRREEMAELQAERTSEALSHWRLGPLKAAPKLLVCDCCGRRCETVSRCWYAGIETFACEQCRGG
jgi:hypothetical protein